MHMVDEFTRYSAAAIILTKMITAKTFMKHWIAIFGAPKTVFLDNGREFIRQSFVEMCEQFNKKIKTTPSESPWSIGLCERHNQTLTSILIKGKQDRGCDHETALLWALCAKNALINNNGFSPAQLVFGRNKNLPNFLDNKLPAQENPNSPYIASHISALHAARSAFIASESSNELKLAVLKDLENQELSST